MLETADWTREKVTFNGAGNQRIIAYLYLPQHVAQPYQVVHFVPAGDVEFGHRSLSASMEDRMAPFVKSGRALFGVVLDGYSERLRPEGQPRPAVESVEFLEHVVGRVTDLRRGLDYLESRQDLDAGRIVFVGPSSGAQIGLVLAAVEQRYRGVVLIGAGVYPRQRSWIAAANPIGMAPHISGPKLMIHGRYDEDLPLRTTAEPLFALLSEPKRLVLFEGGHVPAVEYVVPTLNAWLDETLGPVGRK